MRNNWFNSRGLIYLLLVFILASRPKGFDLTLLFYCSNGLVNDVWLDFSACSVIQKGDSRIVENCPAISCMAHNLLDFNNHLIDKGT